MSHDGGKNFCAYLIPYFNSEKYYQLQSLLRNRKLPTFYLENFVNLPVKLDNKHYDIVLDLLQLLHQEVSSFL